MRTPDSLFHSHLKIYQNIQDQIFSYSVSESRNVHRYRSNFNLGKKKHFEKFTSKKLLAEIKRESNIFVGDFHPFPQSQKGFLRLIKMAENSASICVALECIFDTHQKKVDAYLNSEITLHELREEIDFDTNWPFAWQDYSQILLYCKENRIPVVGINLKSPNASLAQRDLYAANILRKTSKRFPLRKIFCLIGDLHLAEDHLPAKMKGDCMVIHQNIDQLFFQAQSRFSSVPEVIRLSKKEYCVFNSVPWMKAQSYLDWLEGNRDDSDTTDAHEQIYGFSEILASLLKIKYIRDNEFSLFIHPQKPSKLSDSDKSVFKNSKRFCKTNILLSSRSIFLHSLTSNSKTEAATLNLWQSLNNFSSSTVTADTKAFLIFAYFIGFLGSKILNPHRKCTEIADLLSIIETYGKSKKEKNKVSVCENTLNELKNFIPLDFETKPKKLEEVEALESYRMVGYILASRIHQAYESGQVGHREIKSFFTEKNISVSLQKIKRKLKKLKKKPRIKSQTL
jgi:hypothetical protein